MYMRVYIYIYLFIAGYLGSGLQYLAALPYWMALTSCRNDGLLDIQPQRVVQVLAGALDKPSAGQRVPVIMPIGCTTMLKGSSS